MQWVRERYLAKIEAWHRNSFPNAENHQAGESPKQLPRHRRTRSRRTRSGSKLPKPPNTSLDHRFRIREDPPECRFHFRHPGDRSRQRPGPRRRPTGRFEPGRFLQPALHLRWRRSRQDPPDPRHRQFDLHRNPGMEVRYVHAEDYFYSDVVRGFPAEFARERSNTTIVRWTCC
jgi:hypothetical protein